MFAVRSNTAAEQIFELFLQIFVYVMGEMGIGFFFFCFVMLKTWFSLVPDKSSSVRCGPVQPDATTVLCDWTPAVCHGFSVFV